MNDSHPQLNDTLERNQQLSSSLLWKRQREYFTHQGVNAWGQGTVPHYVTSNPFIAGAYSKIALGFLQDWFGTDRLDSVLDPEQPLYIIELGAGSGRFAYHFLKKFLAIIDGSSQRSISVKYVITDFTDSNLNFWRSHSALQSYFERGVLDIARFDMEHDSQLSLECSGEILSAKTLRNPLIVLANYVFDSIPQDAFSIRQGQLYENLITLSTKQDNPDLNDPDLLRDLNVTYSDRSIDSMYYNDTDLDTILEYYQHNLTDTTILFPSVGLRSLRVLRQLAADRLLLLTGDKGYHHESALNHLSQPDITRHGSFSMMVNYHAIGQYVRNSGDLFLNTSHHHNSLNVCACLFGSPTNEYANTRLAYKTAIEQSGPDDFFTLKKIIEPHYSTLTVPQILSYVRLSGWDAKIFLGCFPALRREISAAPESVHKDLSQTIDQIWDTYFHIGEQQDLAFHLAMLLYKIKDYAKALIYLRHSLRLYGNRSSTFHKIALCHYRLGSMEKARNQVTRALTIDPSSTAARNLYLKIRKSQTSSSRTRVNAGQ